MSSPLVLQPLPHVPRSVIWNTLFALLQKCPSPTNTPWKTFSQSLKIWDQVPPQNQPALFLHRTVEEAIQKHAFGVTQWILRCTVWVYFRTENYRTANTYPDQIIDPFKDAFEQLFQPVAQPAQFTLGGIVTNCWIDGEVYTDSGVVDGQAVCVWPISIQIF